MAARSLTAGPETWPIRGVFRISRNSRTEVQTVVCRIAEGETVGRGECVPYARYGESLESVLAQISAQADAVAGGLTRDELQRRMPAGAARNAVDCALWDLEAKLSGRPVHELAGLPPPQPLVTAFTLSLDLPARMHDQAAANRHRPLLKLKLGGGAEDIDRVAAVREATGATLIVDANEAWGAAELQRMPAELARLGVALIEQPLPAGDDRALAGIPHPVAFCADESCHDRSGLAALADRYEAVNIKLDKTGGLTEALALKAEAEAAGMRIMVGCMLATSLAMAPAALVAQGAEFVDLDGPLLLDRDRDPGIRFRDSEMEPPPPALWG